jgi:hypothetical protein
MKYKKYLIACRSNHWETYYATLEDNCLDLKVLALGVTFLKGSLCLAHRQVQYAFEMYKKELLDQGELSHIPQGLEYFATQIDLQKETNTVRIASQYTWEDQFIPNLLKKYPEYTQEQLENHEYIMDVNNFLEVLKQYLNFYDINIPYIILYEDNSGMVQCEKYEPSPEQLEKWKAY